MLRVILLVFALFAARAVGLCEDRSVAVRAETVSPMNILPTFDNGYLVAYERDGFAVYAPDGALAFRTTKSGRQGVVNVAVDVDGAAAAAIESPDQKNGIAVFEPNGAEKRFIRTGEFIPSQVCFAPDHTIWAIGEIKRYRDQPAPEYFILRHFSREGDSLGQFLARSSFENADHAPATVIVGGWGLRIANGRIGAYLTFGGGRKLAQWVEADLNGKELGRWSADFDGSPAAFTQNGDVYARTIAGVLKLDRATRQWNPVSTPGRSLIGAMNDTLVFLSPGEGVLRYVDLPR
jgi:hypothetical protein